MLQTLIRCLCYNLFDLMAQFIPDQIKYQSIRPKGWYSRFKQWPVQPLSSNQFWNPNQIVRFLLKLTNGVMDPYRSHFVFKVNQQANTKLGGLQVDGSAQSFVSQLVVSSRNVEVQRIPQYDTLAAFLTDIGFSQVVCQNRQWQGLGYTSYQTSPSDMSMSSHPVSISGNHNQNTPITLSSHAGKGITPTKPFSSAAGFSVYGQWQGYATGYSGCVLSPQNSLITQPAANVGDQSAINSRGYVNHIRAEYNSQLTLRDSIDSTTSFMNVNPIISMGLNSTLVRTGATAPNTYSLSYPQIMSVQTIGNNVGINRNMQNIAQHWGYNKLFNSKFGTGGFQPLISTTIPQCQFGYGMIAAKPVPVPVRQFNMPLLSTICGVLIPPDQFCLLPLRVLNDLLIQLTLSPYAMFTTGRMDTHEFDLAGYAIDQRRNYQFSQIYYNLHIYQFPDTQITQYLNQSITKGIAITGSSWMLSAQYQIATGAQVRGNWQINAASQYLGQVVILYLSNQYMKHSYCRKQFRLSNNIRSLQFKFNTQFFPSQPYTGNAGNPVLIDNSGDNSQFMQTLLTAYNYKFVTNTPQPRINSFNFAINGRCYDPSLNLPYYSPTLLFSQGAPFNNATNGLVNSDVALGMSWVHQNRYIGRAAYVYSFQAHGHSKNYVIGVDARQARPFEVIIDTWSTNLFPKDQTMYCFTRAGVVILYGQDGVKVLGR